MSKKCDFCGHFNSDSAKTCNTCGIRLDEKEEKIKDVPFIDKYLLPLSIIFIFFIPTSMFLIKGSYEFFQAKYIIISALLIFLGFALLSRGVYKDPYDRKLRIILITAAAFTIFIIPLVYFMTSIEIVA